MVTVWTASLSTPLTPTVILPWLSVATVACPTVSYTALKIHLLLCALSAMLSTKHISLWTYLWSAPNAASRTPLSLPRKSPSLLTAKSVSLRLRRKTPMVLRIVKIVEKRKDLFSAKMSHTLALVEIASLLTGLIRKSTHSPNVLNVVLSVVSNSQRTLSLQQAVRSVTQLSILTTSNQLSTNAPTANSSMASNSKSDHYRLIIKI